MRISVSSLCPLIFSIACTAWGQVGEDTATTKVEEDLARTLLTPAVWREGAPAPGKWQDVSVRAQRKSRDLKTLGVLFGARPQQVQAHYDGDRLVRMDVVYLEAGNFFGFKESREAVYGEKELTAREMRELEKSDENAAKARRDDFARLFKDLEARIPAALEAYCGVPGRSVSIGRNRMLRVRALEYANDFARFRFSAEDDQLISLAVIPAEAAGTKLVTQSGSDRRRDVREQVETLPNGDVVINNIPMVNQGSRGYCAIGTLAMIMQFYSVEVNIDQLAAAAGYTEGDTDKAEIIPIYEAAAKEGKVRMQRLALPLRAREVMKEVEKGRPVLIWRYFSRERDAAHRRFLKEFAKDPAWTVPDPRRDKEDAATWPTPDSGGHASLVTGYNKARNEILFTESWGENNRNRRMRAEELEATVYLAFSFEP